MTNYLIGVLDPAGPGLFCRTVTATFPNRVYKASTVARSAFNAVGIPASGQLTGLLQDAGGSRSVGGTVGDYEGNLGTFDGGCVDNPSRWCDNLANSHPVVLTFMSKAFADMYKPKLPIGAEVARHFVAK